MKLHSSILRITAALLVLPATTNAATFLFNTDPFEGSNASEPGRQIVGGEDGINFDIANDVFALDRNVFGVNAINFANDVVGNLSPVGLNTIVLRTFDPTPFGAGLAATLIADQITTPGPGFFIYFNSNLNLPRLVFSSDLSDPEADLKILFRLENLQGNRDALANFTAANFKLVPDNGNMLLLSLASAGALWAHSRLGSRRKLA
jgi:hypothetical protein